MWASLHGLPLLCLICGAWSCSDDATFQDRLKNGCTAWAGYDCNDTYPGYSEDDMVAVRSKCPVACELCNLETSAVRSSTTASGAFVTGASCMDNSSFQDVKGFRCESWAGHDCRTLLSGYSEQDMAAVRLGCPVACRECNAESVSASSSTTASSVSVATAPCMDNSSFKDVLGFSCTSWTVFNCSASHFGYSTQDMAAVRSGCPVSCDECNAESNAASASTTASVVFVATAPCVDDSSFEDVRGFPCASWAGFSCSYYTGYSESQLSDVRRNCPLSCQLCTSGTLTTSTTRLCMDDESFRDARGFACLAWQTTTCDLSDTFSEPQLAEIRLSCPVSCKVCVPLTTTTTTTTTTTFPGGWTDSCRDIEGYVDKYMGNLCSQWLHRNCKAFDDMPQEHLDDLQQNCRASCGLCTSFSQFSSEEELAMKQVMFSLHGGNSSRLAGKNGLCTFEGVSCRPPFYSIELPGEKLTGTISPAIENLTHLLQLDLSHNNLTGIIPSGLARCWYLTNVNLSHNQLSGSIPEDFGRAIPWEATTAYFFFSSSRPLNSLDLGYNNLTGLIPRELAMGGLSTLRMLSIEHNFITGEIPQELCTTTRYGQFPPLPLLSVKFIRMANNLLHGEFPDCQNAFDNLHLLDVSQNMLTGSGGISSIEHNSIAANFSYNRFEMIPVRWQTCPNSNFFFCRGVFDFEILDLSHNHIKHWPDEYHSPRLAFTEGSYSCSAASAFIPWGAYYLRWGFIRTLLLDANPLDLDVRQFFGSLVDLISLTALSARSCGLMGKIQKENGGFVPRLVYDPDCERCLSQRNCYAGACLADDACHSSQVFSHLALLDLSNNSIVGIEAPNPPALVSANLSYNYLSYNESYLHQSWMSSLPMIDVRFNHMLRAQITTSRGSYCETGGLVYANPRGYHDVSVGVECTWACNSKTEKDVFVDREINETALCRCAIGFGRDGKECRKCHDDEFWNLPVGTLERECKKCPSHSKRLNSHTANSGAKEDCQCLGGFYHDPKDRFVCLRCPNFSYSSGGGCVCVDGYYHDQDHNNRSVCLRCPSYSTSVDGECICINGYYRDRDHHNRSVCLRCPSFSYSWAPGNDARHKCFCNSTAGVQLRDDGLCGCPHGQFMNHLKEQCVRCIAEENCTWIGNAQRSLLPPPVKPGFWAEKVKSLPSFAGHSVYECISKKSCLGHHLHRFEESDDQCAEGRSGVACSLCRPRHYGSSSGGPCKPCDGPRSDYRERLFWLMLSAVPVTFFLTHMFASKGARQLSKRIRRIRLFLKQVLKNVQLLAVLSNISISWPEAVLNVFEWLRAINIDVSNVFMVPCVFEQQTALNTMLVRWMSPLVVLMICFFSFCLSRVLKHMILVLPCAWLHGYASSVVVDIDGFSSIVYAFWSVFFVSIVQDAFAMLSCKSVPNGKTMVSNFLHMECYDSHWWDFFPGVLLSFFFYVILFLVVSWWMVRQVSKCLKMTHCQHRGPFDFVSDGLRDMKVYWIIVIALKDIGLNTVLTIFAGDGTSQLLTSVIILGVYTAAVARNMPFDTYAANYTEMLTSVGPMILLIFTSGFGMKMSMEADAEDGTTNSSRSTWLMIVLVASVLLPVVLGTYELILMTPILSNYLPASLRPLSDEQWQEQAQQLSMEISNEAVQEYLFNAMDFIERSALQHALYGNSQPTNSAVSCCTCFRLEDPELSSVLARLPDASDAATSAADASPDYFEGDTVATALRRAFASAWTS
eukprot:TRINITY_DN4769_c0_g1_i1.p1 TRINITY_DN4769_c0_g1~~TRINITY_DN4769_c0_g1_i1.p1  ORF type:complete len:1725 (+),score=155.69 TRINITY_DN4769_c0_g1_i1:24-5198(+)